MEFSSIGPKHPSPLGAARLTDEAAASRAEREANSRISNAHQRVEESRHESDRTVENIKNEGTVRIETEILRNENAVENEKAKGYEQIRDIQRKMAAEAKRVRREGEAELSKLTEYYKGATYNVRNSGDKQVQEFEKQKSNELLFQKTHHDAQIGEIKSDHLHKMEEIKETTELQRNKLNEANRDEIERLSQNTSQISEQATKRFEGLYQARLGDQQRILDDLNARTNQGISETRLSHTQKLAAYRDRADDPFYRLYDMDAHLTDSGDEFVLRARIPEHEQSRVNVTVRGNQIVLSGQRRSEEKQELSPGHTASTNSFQTFLEAFPFGYPVDITRMSKEFDGDQLTVRLPKKDSNPYKPKVAERPVRSKAPRPVFPDNLPTIKADRAPSDEDPPPSLTQRSKGSRPLG